MLRWDRWERAIPARISVIAWYEKHCQINGGPKDLPSSPLLLL
jgi:hypothetical protein